MRDLEEVAEDFFKVLGPFLLIAGPFGFFSAIFIELNSDVPTKMRPFLIGLFMMAVITFIGYSICRYVGFIRPRKK